ncbi:MAG: hypothetical protein J5580_03830 [Clostridia bacterium]|nr:hypothetical protein [Clostridia bacterium]
MSGINLNTVTNDLATMGLFGKTEYATIRNINFQINNINATARYVGGIAGIAINTNFVDVNVTSTGVIKGANIVGGVAGLAVVFRDLDLQPMRVENYNVHSNVSVTADFANGDVDPGAAQFDSGVAYTHQTLHAAVKGTTMTYTQGFGTAGGVFGFVTSNPNNYREVTLDSNGNLVEIIHARQFEKTIYEAGSAPVDRSSYNTNGSWFLKAPNGEQIIDTVEDNQGVYYKLPIVMSHISGAVKDIAGNVAGGLIGIMDETIELKKPSVTALNTLSGKYYLGGVVGINLGKISGAIIDTGKRDSNNKPITKNYEVIKLNSWTISSSAGKDTYVYRMNPSVGENKDQWFWGMTVGAVAGYNNGIYLNDNSGVIENITANVNVLGSGSSTLQYIIGGVVGVNGNYGYIDNAVNEDTTIKNATFTSATAHPAANSIGYHFGRIVGRGVAETNDPLDFRMKVIPVELPDNTAGHVLNKRDKDGNLINNFETKGYNYSGRVNAFGIDENTLKVQTMTMEEYYDYLKIVLKNKNLPFRVKKLQDWVRSLSTYTEQVEINHELVWVEKFNEEERIFLENWLNDNSIFDDRGGASVLANYQAYLRYSAVGVAGESESDFKAKIAKYRKARYDMAIEFFTYQDANTPSNSAINGSQNREFTWAQYEKYLILKKFAHDQPLTPQEYSNVWSNDEVTRGFAQKYGEDVASLVYVDPTKGVFAEYKNNKTVMIYSQIDFVNMLRTIMNDENQFTNQDPLQVYLNYAVLAANGEQLLLNDGSRLTFAQYCYYMKHIYGLNYAPDFNYSVPKDFSATQEANKITCYLDYVSIQKDLDQKQTVPEFIDLIKRYEEIVTQKEFEWITTGHLGGGGARISTIGGIELDWADAAEWNNIVNAGKIEKGDNHSINYPDANQKWEALTEFAKAQSKGMDIHKYNEMINLGGNLYYFLYATDGNGNLKYTTVGANEETPADKYIFDLKCAQYGWSQAQIDFVRDKYAQKTGDNQIVSYDTQYALTATTEGLISDYFGKGAIRAVKATDTQIMSDAVWFADNNGDTNKNDGEPAGVFIISGETYKNGDGQNYYVYVPYGQTERMIDLRANGIDGAALYVDVDENKMFGTVVSASGGSSDSHEAGKDILAVYELEPHKMNSSSSENYVFFHAVKIDGTVTWYDDYPSEFFTDENTKNDTLYGYYEKPDFYTADKEIDETTHTVTQISNVVFYKIARQIKEDSGRHQMTSDATEATGNAFDYLEEALWWRAQKFTVEQFDKLKVHAMIKSLSAGYVLPSNNYTTRETGFTLADDWTAEVIVGDKTVKSGFVNDQFTQAEYAEIALGGKYVGDTWYSNYADYKLFCMLNNPGTIPVIEITPEIFGVSAVNGKGIDPTTIKQGLPSTSEYRNPFASKEASNAFVDNIADENDLAEATELGSDHVAFLTLFRAGASAADYINWSLGQNGTDGFNYKIDENTTKYFRMNHYIYYVQNNLGAEIKIDGVSKFDAEDYRWVLNQDVRKEIQYAGVTPDKRTTDLVEYRMNWRTVRTDGTVLEFMTFRDYCEWINIYAYSSAYQIARGDYQDAETGETLTSTDGWLTIEAFAVWKRMEKYENNVEYLNKISTTAAQQIITAPIYKRKISTTVFPIVKPSGEQQRNSTTGMLESDKMTLEAPLSSKDYNDGKAEYEEKMYGANGYVNKSVALANAGKSMGMCETAMGVALATYNEVSSQYSSSYSNYQAIEDAKKAYDDAVAAYNASVVAYTKLRKEIDKLLKEIDALSYKKICLDWYGWPDNAQPGMDVNYQRPYADRFEYNERYNIRQVTRSVLIGTDFNRSYETLIDDAQFAKDPAALYEAWGNTGLAGYGISTAVGEIAYIKLDETRNFTGSITSDYNEYAQLYIPYDYFETACQMIKSAYSGDYAGYHNYMKYWARNGNVNWICDQTAYVGELDDKLKVNYTYKQAGFWNNYKGTQSPVDGTDSNVSGYAAGDKKAYGWLVKEN